jgi:glycosyltransferase involved in cell wall biosynthesis
VGFGVLAETNFIGGSAGAELLPHPNARKKSVVAGCHDQRARGSRYPELHFHVAIKILLINYEYPPLGGGAGQATAALAREFAAAGREPLVLTSRFRDQPAEEVVAGVRLRRVAVVRRRADRCTPIEMLTFLAGASTVALREIRAWKPHAAIAFFGIPSGPVGLLLKLTTGVPYIVSLRGGDVPGFQPYDLALFHKLLGPVIRLLWRNAAAVVANSAGLQTLAQRFAPERPIGVIPNGVDATTFHPPAEMVPRSGPVRLLFVGRVVYQKGLDVLLHTLAALPPALDWQLEIIGDGDARPALTLEAAQLGLASRITFAGWCDRAVIAERYRQADLFVFPSRDEGMPNVVLEAMASGLPIVATAIAGSEELVREGENGCLVPSGEAPALADALARLIAQPEQLRAMGRASREIVEREYTWTRVAACYLDLLREKCARH